VKKTKKCALQVFMALVFMAITAGCGSKAKLGKKVMELPELDVSIEIPAGWTLDNPLLCHKGDYTGMLVSEPLGDKTFEEFVNQASTEFGQNLVSKTALQINGYDAIQTVTEAPSAGTKLLTVYIHKDGKVIWAGFVISIYDYPKYEPSLLKSIESIIIK